MDKLKQVLKYQFWILLVVALILPFVGWSMATSGLVSEAAARTETLKKLRESLKVETNDPNTTWEQALQAINVDQGKQSNSAHQDLYDRQLKLMVWPDRMPSDPSLINTNLQEYARTTYAQWVEQVRQVVKPFDETSETGMVEYSEDLLPRPDTDEWVQMPSVKQIEAAQEDLWLLTSLLKAIGSVNKDATTRFDAPVRRIEELYLRGGSKGARAPSSAATGSGSPGGHGGSPSPGGASGAMPSGMGGGQFGMRGGLGGGRDFAGSTTSIAPVKINPDDDLGPETTAPLAGSPMPAGSPKGSSAGHTGTSNAPMTGMMPGSAPGGAGGRWGGSSVGRYREERPEWKTRGFYLEVIMDHRRVPDLLVALANSDWPVNVLRVQMADYQDEDLADADGGMAGPVMPGSGRGGPGMHGGGSPRMPQGMPGGMRSGSPAGPLGHIGGSARPGPRSGRPSEEGEAAVSASNRSAFDDPNLASVAIVGTIYIFKKPAAQKPEMTSPAGGTPPVTPAVTAPVAASVAAPATVVGNGADKPADTADGEVKSAPAADDEKDPEKPEDPAAGEPDSKPADEKPAEAAVKSDRSN